MSCSICANDLSGALMTMPCCQVTLHTTCGIRQFAFQVASTNSAICVCGVLHYSLDPYLNVEETLPATPAFSQAVTACNTLRITAAKASRQLRSLVRRQKTLFFEEVAPHIQAIKAIKKATMASLRSDDIYKTHARAQKRYIKAFTTILKDYALNSYNLRRQLRIRLKDKILRMDLHRPQRVCYGFRVRL